MKIISIDSGCKNNAIVKLQIEDSGKITLLQTDLLNFCGNKKVKQCSFESIIKSLIEQLKNYDTSDVDLVLIENIPSRLNMMVKSISIATYSFFISQGLNTKLVSPSKKLSKEQNKLTYKERKAEGIKKCFELLTEYDKKKINEEFKNKKLPVADITDCIIQAHEYYKRNIVKK